MWVHQFNKATTLMGGVDDGGSCAYVEGKGISQNLLINFAMNLKLLQKQSLKSQYHFIHAAAAAAAKLLQSCPTLCDPIDGNPPGSSVHRILQARILEWAAISFSIIHTR